ncbi:MAG: leucyl aminopeptidase family protein [Christensenellales bacterium]
MNIVFNRLPGIQAYLTLKGLAPFAAVWEEEQQNQLTFVAELERFEGKLRQVCAVYNAAKEESRLYAGLGEAPGEEEVRVAVAALMDWCSKREVPQITLHLEELDDAALARAAAESVLMANYRYGDYLTDKKELAPKTVGLVLSEDHHAEARLGTLLGEAVCIARNLVNEPANVQTPAKLVDEVMALGAEYGFEVEVLDEIAIKKENMHALLAVSQGSEFPARFIVMRHRGAPECDQLLGLVGKGITFDTGGIQLKRNSDRLIGMKHDMAGGATMAGLMCAVAASDLRVNLTAVIPASLNDIGSKAYKPGDIIGSKKGKSILIKSTDAEGRLAIIDGLQYLIQKEGATALLDIGTLTGAGRVVFGEYACPVMHTSDELFKALSDGAKDAGEMVAFIPWVEEMRQGILCDIADYCNTARSETGGMITAGLFIREFTDGLPWLHMDGAGVLWMDKGRDYWKTGGSGWGVRTLYHFLSRMAV